MNVASLGACVTVAIAAVVFLVLRTDMASHVLKPASIAPCGYWHDQVLRNHMMQFCPNPSLVSADPEFSGKKEAMAIQELAKSTQSDESFGMRLSLQESFGFFDESDTDWQIRKQIHHMVLSKQKQIDKAFQQCQLGHAFWHFNYMASFQCAHAAPIGNFLVCDPHKITKKASVAAAAGKQDCLVYSVGSDGIFTFEEDVLESIYPECDIHTFDPFPISHYLGEGAQPPKFVSYHAYPVGAVVKENRMGPFKAEDVPDGKSVSTIVEELGHKGRAIDMFKINCEGCEYETYRSWFDSGVDIRQILIEMHWDHCDATNMPTKIHAMWQHLQEHGYVPFAKTNNAGWDPEAVASQCDFSFIKLDLNFSRVS